MDEEVKDEEVRDEKQSKPKEIVVEMIPIAQRIKVRRIVTRLKQREIASAMGVSVDTYREWENARNNMLVWRLPSLAKALGVPIGYFFGEGEEEGRDYQREIDLSEAIDALQRAKSRLPQASHPPRHSHKSPFTFPGSIEQSGQSGDSLG